MRVIKDTSFDFGSAFGLTTVPNQWELRFSEQEKAVLRKAAAIADAARDRLKAELGDDNDHWADTELAKVTMGIEEVLDGVTWEEGE